MNKLTFWVLHTAGVATVMATSYCIGAIVEYNHNKKLWKSLANDVNELIEELQNEES